MTSSPQPAYTGNGTSPSRSNVGSLGMRPNAVCSGGFPGSKRSTVSHSRALAACDGDDGKAAAARCAMALPIRYPINTGGEALELSSSWACLRSASPAPGSTRTVSGQQLFGSKSAREPTGDESQSREPECAGRSDAWAECCGCSGRCCCSGRCGRCCCSPTEMALSERVSGFRAIATVVETLLVAAPPHVPAAVLLADTRMRPLCSGRVLALCLAPGKPRVAAACSSS